MRRNPSEIYFHAPWHRLLKNLNYVASSHINCEIYLSADSVSDITPQKIKRVNKFFKNEGLKKIMHGPFLDLNSGSFDEGIRKFSLERYLKTLTLADKLETRNIVFHTGFNPIYYKHATSKWLDKASETWEKVAKKAEGLGIRLAIENSIDTNPQCVIELIKRIGSKNFKACFDVAHYNIFGERSIKAHLKEYPKGSIAELHLSDNKGDIDSHLALGEGEIDFKSFLKDVLRLGHNPILTVEPHTLSDIPKSLAYLKRIIPDAKL